MKKIMTKQGVARLIEGVEEVAVEMVLDADSWMDRIYWLSVTDGNGRTLKIQIDGVQIQDIVTDVVSQEAVELRECSPDLLEMLLPSAN